MRQALLIVRLIDGTRLDHEPEDDPLTVEDLSTTVYSCLGINADKELMAPGNRPIEIVDGGKIVKELLA